MKAVRWGTAGLVLLLAMTLVVSCKGGKSETGGSTGAATPPKADVAGTVVVFVPCGMAGPFGEIKTAFQDRYPNVKMELSVENVDVQASLIEDGKRQPDAWLSLGDVEINRAKAAGLLEGEPTAFAYNSLAFLVAKGNPCKIESYEDLTKPAVRTIALPTERNSSGFYVAEALKAKGLWEALQPKLWLTDHPSDVKTQLTAGKADVGLAYYPCMKEQQKTATEPDPSQGKVEMLGRLDDERAARIPILAAVAKGAKSPELGRLLVDFLLEPSNQAIWAKWDFEPVVPSEADKLVKTALTMSCGAGLRPYMDPAIAAFRKTRPDVKIDVNYAGSGCLLSQLTFAKRGDLYIPGEEFYMAQAREKGYVSEDRVIGYLEPVLLVAAGNPKGIQGIEDMARRELRVGLGNTEVTAAGRVAKTLLERAGLWEGVQAGLDVEVGNVPELANSVQIGSVDVAVVWNITATPVAEKCDTVEIRRDIWEPIAVPLGALTFSKHPEETKAFLEFCLSAEGQDIAREAGMTPVAEVAVPESEARSESGV